jgi:co-chaperonin GroES (HSP10)
MKMSDFLLATNPKNPKVTGTISREALIGTGQGRPPKPERQATQLPKPSGYHILCAVPMIDKEFDNSSIVKSEKTLADEATLSVVLFVVAMGPDCYKDESKYPTGPWCKEGDFIVTRPYTGSRLNIHGQEFKIINEDSVEAVVESPVGVRRN